MTQVPNVSLNHRLLRAQDLINSLLAISIEFRKRKQNNNPSFLIEQNLTKWNQTIKIS